MISILLVVFLIFALVFMITSISGAPWVPARNHDIESLLHDAELKKGEVFFELGCGDGRLVKAAAQQGAKAIGYELNPLLWLIAYCRTLTTPNAKVFLGDLWRVKLADADVIMTFLVPRTMPRLGRKVEQEMKAGSRLISYIFPIPGKKPDLKGKNWFIYKKK